MKLTIGQKISFYRKLSGLTQEELAKRVEKSRATISQIESGKTIPNKYLLKEIIKIFNVTYSDFIEEPYDSNLEGLKSNQNEKTDDDNGKNIPMLPAGAAFYTLNKLDGQQKFLEKIELEMLSNFSDLNDKISTSLDDLKKEIINNRKENKEIKMNLIKLEDYEKLKQDYESLLQKYNSLQSINEHLIKHIK